MRSIHLLLLLLFAAPLALAQNVNASLTATLAAHGGPAVAALHSIQIIGTATASGGTQPITISASMDGRVRMDFGSPVERSIVTTDQGKTEIRGALAVPKPPHVGVFGALDMLGVLGIRRMDDPTVQQTSIGTGTVAGYPTIRIKAATGQQKVFYGRTLKDEAEVDIDAASGLLAAIRRVQYADQSLDRPFWLGYQFSDYRNVQGLAFPFRIDSTIDGRPATTLIVTSVTLDPVLPALLWEVH